MTRMTNDAHIRADGTSTPKVGDKVRVKPVSPSIHFALPRAIHNGFNGTIVAAGGPYFWMDWRVRVDDPGYYKTWVWGFNTEDFDVLGKDDLQNSKKS